MPEQTDLQIDERLVELERDLGPVLRAAYRGYPMRGTFASELRQQLNATASRPPAHPRLRALGQRGWAVLAAVLVIGAASSVAVFANRPQPASAAEVLDRVQAEALAASVPVADAGACSPATGTARTGGVVIASGSLSDQAPVQIQSGAANQLSDRLAQALGVSGDRVRQAMLQTLEADLPTGPPPDPVAAIARQLGVSQQQVCAAFLSPQDPGQTVTMTHAAGAGQPGGDVQQFMRINGTQIDLNNVDASQLSAPAQRLGVTPERLVAAVRAAVPAAPPAALAPPNKDEIISRFAHNLGLSEDQVRAAITQVEGPGHFYFTVSLPGLSKQ
jgi:hypothetical protein